MACELGTIKHTRGGIRSIESFAIHTAENDQIRLLLDESSGRGSWELVLPRDQFLEKLGAALAPLGAPPAARCTEHTWEWHPHVPGLRRCAACFQVKIPQGRGSR